VVSAVGEANEGFDGAFLSVPGVLSLDFLTDIGVVGLLVGPLSLLGVPSSSGLSGDLGDRSSEFIFEEGERREELGNRDGEESGEPTLSFVGVFSLVGVTDGFSKDFGPKLVVFIEFFGVIDTFFTAASSL